MKTLKTITVLSIMLISYAGISQAKLISTNADYSKTSLSNVKVEIEAESLKDLEHTFNLQDLETFFEDTEVNDAVEFKITCTKDSDSNPNFKKEISYKIVGSIKDKDAFLKRAERIYNAAKKYYLN